MSQYIYWSDISTGKIERVKIDGSGRQVIVSGLSAPQGVYVHHRNSHLYWVDRGTDKIQRSNLDGTNIINIITSGLVNPKGLYIDEINDKIYWTDITLGTIKKSNLDGSGIEIFASGLSEPEDINIDNYNNKIYWTEAGNPNDRVRRANLNGTNIEILITGLNNPGGIDLDLINGKMYFEESIGRKIRKANLNGTSLETIHNTIGTSDGTRIDVINNKLYWTEIGPGALYKSDLNGNNKSIILSGLLSISRIDLYTESVFTSDNIQLFISGPQLIIENLGLFIHGKQLISDSINLSLIHPSFFYNSLSIFVHGLDSSTHDLDLFVFNLSIEQNDLTFYIDGIDNVIGQLTFFVEGILENNTNINLATKGIWMPTAISCPALDPLASIQISSDLIQIYQSRIDALINQLGKNILLEFDPIREPCTNCLPDIISNRSVGIYRIGGPIPFTRGQKCPFCKGIGFLEQKVTQCLKCLIKWNPREIKNYGISVSKYNNIVRLKAFLTDSDNLSRAKTAIIDYDIQNIFKQRVKLIKGPVPVGLREDRFCVSFWELI